VIAPSDGDNENEVYVTRADAHGYYSFALPAGSVYYVIADSPPRSRKYVRVKPGSHLADLALDAPPAPRPSNDAIVAWLRSRATPLTPDGDLDPGQARALDALVGDAPLVAMGEATHGSAEFADWRRRVFETLVRDKGFTVYAVEVGWPDALALDDYVVTGRGDPVHAIHALTTWKDETTETLSLVSWMRAYNADPKHAKKVHFEGFDVYTPSAVPLILAYLAKVDPAAKEEAHATLAPFADVGCDTTYPTLPEEKRAQVTKAVDALVARFDEKHGTYAAKSSEEEWARARQLVRIVQQAETSYVDWESERDPQMAENVGWLVRHQPGTKLLLDAHSGHVSAVANLRDLGERLRKEWGRGYVPIGFAFGEGGFLALDRTNGKHSNDLLPFALGRAPEDTFDGALGLAKFPAFLVDLRATDGPVGAWLRSPQRAHSIGTDFWGNDGFITLDPSRSFDAILYVDHVSPIHPLPSAK
jgi:erythromycin esterase